MLEFTSDQDALQQTLLRLRPRSVTGAGASSVECPYFSYYMADLLVNKQDQMAIQAARSETVACGNINIQTTPISSVDGLWQGTAQQALTNGDHETHLALDVLSQVVRRLSAMPGQRGIVLASPGFITPFYYQELGEVINRAIRANVIISSLDARGLWTLPGFSAADAAPRGGPNVLATKSLFASDEALAQEEVLASLAAGTGGTFIHNNNDLGFSPSNLKSDGKFHSLKVVLANSKGLNLQARKGYYAPKHMTGAAEQAHQEIEDALFNREVLKDFPGSPEALDALLGLAVMDGDITTAGSQGLWADCAILKFDRQEKLAEDITVSISAKPTYSANAPQWKTIAGS